MHGMTLNDAENMRLQQIQTAHRLRLYEKIKYLCTHDPSSIAGNVYTRPLVGSGKSLRYTGDVDGSGHVAVLVSDRPGKEVFHAAELPGYWSISRYRHGLWVDKLLNEYERVRFRRDNPGVVDLYDNFGPLEDG
jgi:hypothetical protein